MQAEYEAGQPAGTPDLESNPTYQLLWHVLNLLTSPYPNL